MEDSSTKIDNIIDLVTNNNYSGIIKSIKKLLSKEPNQSPRNLFVINLLKMFAFYNLKQYKSSEEALQNSLKNFSGVNLSFFSRYQFLIYLILSTTYNEPIYQQILDIYHESTDKVRKPNSK